ncbi:MAG: FAD-binding oxidoreductase [Bacillota bacterium]
MENIQKYDVAIVGGGVVGAAAAWKLSAAGAKVVLLEKGDICSGASAANPGFCVLSYRENALAMRLALLQQASWEKLEKELGDLEYSPCGGMMPLSSEEQEAALSGLCRHAHGLGLKDIGIVTAKEAIALEPALSPKAIIGACWCPGEGRVNPFKLNLAMIRRAKDLGARVLTHTPVTGVELSGGRIGALYTPKGEFRADLIVCAAGAWAREFTRMAGAEVPIRYERGEAMVSMQVAPRITRMITDGALFVKSAAAPMVVGACMAQSASGNIVLAQATTRPGNYDKTNTYEGPRAVAKRVVELFPSLGDLEIIRMWAGLVSYVDDGRPVFGPMDSPENLFIANSFHSAIALSPGIGEMLADFYRTGRVAEEAKPYSPMRFVKVVC